MSLVAIGLSHNTSPIELRERLAFSNDEIAAALYKLRKRLDGAGVVILSTCNRVEIYASHQGDFPELCTQIRGFLCEHGDVTEDEINDAIYEYEGHDAVHHVFRVTSSLDSLVVGESQILGQVRDAYLTAQSDQATDKIINALFQKAMSVAKSVRTHSRIGEGKVSVSSAAIDLAVSIFGSLTQKTVVVVGSGEMAELALKSIISEGVGTIIIANRSIEKAATLAEKFHGEAISLDQLGVELKRADILISSTAAPQFILGPDEFKSALKSRTQKPMFVIDIALPRDIDPAVNEIDNVYLYDIDSLQEIVEENMESRRKEIERCNDIVTKGVESFVNWMRSLEAEPTLVSMSEEMNEIRERELKKTLASLPDLTEKQRDEVTYLTERIVNNLLQRHMTELKREIRHHDPQTVIHLVKKLFGIKEP